MNWIPVEQQLPELGDKFSGLFLATEICAGIYSVTPAFYNGYEWYSCFADEDGLYEHLEVIAWMPLPDPYEK